MLLYYVLTQIRIHLRVGLLTPSFIEDLCYQVSAVNHAAQWKFLYFVFQLFIVGWSHFVEIDFYLSAQLFFFLLIWVQPPRVFLSFADYFFLFFGLLGQSRDFWFLNNSGWRGVHELLTRRHVLHLLIIELKASFELPSLACMLVCLIYHLTPFFLLPHAVLVNLLVQNTESLSFFE